jgi:hypothetical protein
MLSARARWTKRCVLAEQSIEVMLLDLGLPGGGSANVAQASG